MAREYSFSKNPAPGISIDVDEIDLDGFSSYARSKILNYLKSDACPMLQSYAQNNRKWTDRTNTARIGLKSDVETSGNIKQKGWEVNVRLYHTAKHNGFEYGKMLEYAYEKRYAILEPTMRLKGPDVIRNMHNLLGSGKISYVPGRYD